MTLAAEKMTPKDCQVLEECVLTWEEVGTSFQKTCCEVSGESEYW